MHYQQLTLFSLQEYQSVSGVEDPAWDKLEAANFQVATAPSVPVELQLSLKKLAPEQSLPTEEVDLTIAPEQSNTELHVKHNISNLQNPNNSVRAQVTTNTTKFAPEQNYLDKKNTQWVETYWVKRDGEKHYYYRYCWMEGRKKHRLHISGGNVRSHAAQQRKQAVEEAIALDLTPHEIKELINKFCTIVQK